MAKMHAYLMDVYRNVDTSKRLEKIAQYYADDEDVKTAALKAKTAVDAEIFEMAKRASLKSELAQKALTGLAYSAAPLAGAGLVGHSLLSKAKHDTAEATEDIRNKVLQTALGLGGIGAGLYGLHRLTGGGPLGTPQEKTGEDNNANIEDLVTKLAAVGKIEDMLGHLDFENLSPEAQKLACELQVINRGYGVQLLHEASHSEDSQ